MSEQAKIMTRIREALTLSAPVAGQGHDKAKPTPPLPPPDAHRRVMPAVGRSGEDQLALFAMNAAELRADFKQLADMDALAAELRSLAEEDRWKRIASHPGQLCTPAGEALGLPLLLTSPTFDKHELEQCDVGISECDALVAQTGTVVLTSRSAGGRALSCLPPHHIVLARRDQLVPDLPTAFELVKSRYGSSYPSMISLITGPSRTGDIERILVLGAHGPRKLSIFLLDR